MVSDERLRPREMVEGLIFKNPGQDVMTFFLEKVTKNDITKRHHDVMILTRG